MIGGQSPNAYLNQIQTHETVQLNDASMDAILATHSIDPGCLRQDDFEGFMSARQRSLLTQIEAVMGKTLLASNEAIPEDDSDDET